jgi:hypothetical protein
MEIKEGQVKLDKPTKEINIYIREEEEYYKAKIVSVTQDKLGRVYIKVE